MYITYLWSQNFGHFIFRHYFKHLSDQVFNVIIVGFRWSPILMVKSWSYLKEYHFYHPPFLECNKLHFWFKWEKKWNLALKIPPKIDYFAPILVIQRQKKFGQGGFFPSTYALAIVKLGNAIIFFKTFLEIHLAGQNLKIVAFRYL